MVVGNAILLESGVFARVVEVDVREVMFKGAVGGGEVAGTRGDCTRGPGLGVRELVELSEPLCTESGEVAGCVLVGN